VIPGCGSIERLAHLVGRAHALEIVIGSDDYDASTAQEPGYVNRIVPDADLDAFIDAFARWVVSFDRRPIATAKRLIDRSTLPETGHLLESRPSSMRRGPGRRARSGSEAVRAWPAAARRVRPPLRPQKGYRCP
jgi:enoyl-CoA hydratase/carnithine racemase